MCVCVCDIASEISETIHQVETGFSLAFGGSLCELQKLHRIHKKRRESDQLSIFLFPSYFPYIESRDRKPPTTSVPSLQVKKINRK